MIEHIEIEGFKSLEKVSLDLGPLNIFVGTNASGKTNFLEALRVLQGISYGYTVDEIFNGKPQGAGNVAWEGVRGGSKFAYFINPWTKRDDVRFRAVVGTGTDRAEYFAHIWPRVGTATQIVTAGGKSVTLDQPGRAGNFDIVYPTVHDPLLAQAIRSIREQLRDVQWLLPSATVQREYSAASRAVRMGDHGENFASLLKTILSDKKLGPAYIAWLKELTPAELDTIEVLDGPAGDFTFALRKAGIDFPARVLSDGTLRFAAIAAAFFQPDPPKRLLLEEIEDGLHPTRLQLLVELLKTQTGQGVEQVIATTHSPYTIAWLREEDFRYVFLCAKNEETGATSITPLSQIPRLMELVRHGSIADLFVQGWLETAV